MIPDNPSMRVAERFLEALFQKLAAAERIETRDKAPGEHSPMRRNFFASAEEAAKHASSVGYTRDVYVGVAARRGEDSTKKGVHRISTLWADLDAKDGYTYESRLSQLIGLPHHPSMVVWTGGGFHIYWLLTGSAESPEELDLAELVMRRIATGLQSDPVHDRSRIMRVPGSLNHKYGEPRSVKLEHYEPHRRYDLVELQEMAESLPSGSDDGAVAGGKVPHEVLSEPVRQHSRNLSLTSIAGSLRDRGLDVETISAVLVEVNKLRCLPPLEDEEVTRIAQSIGRYPAGKPRYRRSPIRRLHSKKKAR
jgi:hypothetical protein